MTFFFFRSSILFQLFLTPPLRTLSRLLFRGPQHSVCTEPTNAKSDSDHSLISCNYNVVRYFTVAFFFSFTVTVFVPNIEEVQNETIYL